jgi:hypothetical protein
MGNKCPKSNKCLIATNAQKEATNALGQQMPKLSNKYPNDATNAQIKQQMPKLSMKCPY